MQRKQELLLVLDEIDLAYENRRQAIIKCLESGASYRDIAGWMNITGQGVWFIVNEQRR